MKTILFYGDSNTWGFIPDSYNEVTCLAERYRKVKRWTGKLQQLLGAQYEVIEEGLNGRTTVLDDPTPGRPYRNGLTYLPFCLEAHYPIDLVIIALGTNDTKKMYKRSVNEISEGIRQLIKFIKTSNKGPAGKIPKILVIAPQPIIRNPDLFDQYDENSIIKSENLASAYQKIAIEEKCEFLDASQFIISSKLDGVHLDESQSELLSRPISEKIKEIL